MEDLPRDPSDEYEYEVIETPEGMSLDASDQEDRDARFGLGMMAVGAVSGIIIPLSFEVDTGINVPGGVQFAAPFWGAMIGSLIASRVITNRNSPQGH